MLDLKIMMNLFLIISNLMIVYLLLQKNYGKKQ